MNDSFATLEKVFKYCFKQTSNYFINPKASLFFKIFDKIVFTKLMWPKCYE